MKAILTFHSLDNTGSVLSYPPLLFIRLIENLCRSNIPIVSLDALLANTIHTGVALTFDDGIHSVLTEALPPLRACNAPAHIYIATNWLDRKKTGAAESRILADCKMLDWDDINTLQAGGFSIEAHTQNHPDMRALSTEQVAEECEGADEVIAANTGNAPKHFAYPFGYHNRQARDYCRGRYKCSVTTELRYLSDDENAAALPRLDSYYLQHPWFVDHLNYFVTRAYMHLRWCARTVRGSHCLPDHDRKTGLCCW